MMSLLFSKRFGYIVTENKYLPFRINSLPTISALKFNGALTMAVGTSTGQVNMFKVEISHVRQYFGYILGDTYLGQEVRLFSSARVERVFKNARAF